MANGTVESGKEVIHTEGGGFTAFPKCRSRSSLHLVGTIHGLGTPKEFEFQRQLPWKPENLYCTKKKQANRPSACMLDVFSIG
jgi:hypothetical protein